MHEARYREAEARLWESVGARPKEEWLELSTIGARVRAQIVGDGPPILFLHGGGVCGTTWASLVARLDDFRCLVVDRPGCGLSEPLGASLTDVARLEAFGDALVADVFDALKVDRAFVAATSFGGYMALRSAAAHPQRIDKLMLFGFPVGAPVEKTPMAMRIGGVPWIAGLMARIPPSERMVRAIFKSIGLKNALESGQVSQEMLDWFLSMLRDTDTLQNETRLPQVVTFSRGLNRSLLLPASLLAQIQAPAYFLWGEQDPFGGEETARPFVASLPDAQLELMPQAGHAVWMDDAGHAAEVTRRFLSG